jgi:hypothetical protein
MLQSIDEERRKDEWKDRFAICMLAGAAVATILWVAFLARLLVNPLIDLF